MQETIPEFWHLFTGFHVKANPNIFQKIKSDVDRIKPQEIVSIYIIFYEDENRKTRYYISIKGKIKKRIKLKRDMTW